MADRDPLTVAAFTRVKRYILARGDRRTYCNMFNLNPHVSCDGFEAYLHPDVGQRNINCDPALSDFDRLVIQDVDRHAASPHAIYFDARVVDDRLEFDPAHAEPLRRSLAALLAAAAAAGM